MRISASYTIDDWKALTFKSEDDWELAVDMFKDRLKTRYLEHIDVLISRKTSGFAVLSLDCVLVETLQQFRNGANKTPYGKSKQYFVDFLTGTTFAQHFTEETAKIFYTEIRCGLLHQSEAEGTSRIKRGMLPLVALTADNKSIVVNVHRFHDMLKDVIESYAQELLQPQSVDARGSFRKKMNFICRVEGKDI
jgi:hypothetical protein